MSTAVAIVVPEKYAGRIQARFSTPDLPAEIEASKSKYDISRLDWIPWGQTNDDPDKYLKMLETNVMFSRIASVLAAMIQGDGLVFEGRDAKLSEAYLTEIGVDSRFIEKCSWDLAVLNAVGIRASRTSRNNGGTVSALQHVPAANLRSGKPDKYGRVKTMQYAVDWNMIDTRGKLIRGNREVKQNEEYYAPEVLPVYNYDKVEANQILWRNKTNPQRTFYPLPPAATAFKTMQLQDAIVSFHLNSINNGASSTMVLTYPQARKIAGEEDSEAWQQADFEEGILDELVKSIEKDMRGVQNAGRPIVIPYDPNNPDWKPTLQAFPSSDNDKKWTTLISLNETMLLTAFGIPTGELVGIAKSTGFSSKSEELKVALEIMRVNTINPLQNILTECLNLIISDMGFACKVGILANNPISIQLTLDMVTAGVVTKDEYRAYQLNLKPLPVADVAPADAAPAPPLSQPNRQLKLWPAVSVNW